MRLSPLFCATKINQIWRDLANQDVINHPHFGLISPNTLRAQYVNTPCPHCLRTMVHGSAYKTENKEEAENRNFFYRTKDNKKKYCQAGNTYFSNQYVSTSTLG